MLDGSFKPFLRVVHHVGKLVAKLVKLVPVLVARQNWWHGSRVPAFPQEASKSTCYFFPMADKRQKQEHVEISV